MDDERDNEHLRNSSRDEKKKKKKKRNSTSREVAQLERDIQAKARSSSALSPGVIASSGNLESGGGGGGGGMSADAMAKSRGRPLGSAPTSPGVQDSRDASAAIRSLEADVQAKNRARGSRSSGTAGAVSATGGSQIPSKASGRSLQSSDSARLEARNLAEQQAGLLLLEEDLQAKNQARTTTPNLLDPTQRKMSRDAQKRDYDTGAAAGLGVAGGINASFQDPSKDFFDDFDEDKRTPEDNGGSIPFATADTAAAEAPQESPALDQNGSGDNNQDTENLGLIAELAPNQVIDPLELQVIPSEKEEEMEERKRFRRYLILGFIGLLIVSAAVVIPVVVVFGRPAGPIEPTMAPSLAPTGVPSLAPSTTRLADILEWAGTISDPADLLNITSPQYLAATWVADEDEVQAEMGGLQLRQRYVLAVYYFSTGGDEWEECNRNVACVVGFSWLAGSRSECLWHGIRCSTDGQVQKILHGNQSPLGNNQVGTLPSELSELTDITSLVILVGEIKGTIPSEFGRLTKMDSIFIQDQLLTGTIPEEIMQNCKELQLLAFGDNFLNGTIPASIATLPLLLDLQLWGNQFTGTIPTEFGSVTDTIRNLELQNNLLGGSIPNNLFNMVNMTTLSLDDNELIGSIPEAVGQLSILRILEVSGNTGLTGGFPEAIYTMPALRTIRVGDTGLSGPMSERLRELNGTLMELNAPNTGFTGSLPVALSLLTNLDFLFLHGTQMIGSVPLQLCTAGLINLTMPTAVDCSATANCCKVQA